MQHKRSITLTIAVNVIKPFSSSPIMRMNNRECFCPVNPSQFDLIFSGNAGADTKVEPLKGRKGTNALAYLVYAIVRQKRFIGLTPVVNVIKLFSFITDDEA